MVARVLGPDLLTRIINIRWKIGEPQQWLLAKFKPDAFVGDAFNAYRNLDAIAANGSQWSSIAGGASGSGLTVLVDGPVAYGKPEGDEPACFLRAVGTDKTVYRGLVDAGKIRWAPVWSAPTGAHEILSISFANKLFFVNYAYQYETDRFTTRLAVSTNGRTFAEGIDPFAGIDDPGQFGQKTFGGNVAYNKTTNRYAIIGSMWHTGTETNVGMCWASSSNGTNWGAGSPATATEQPGGQLSFHYSTVAAGNGTFVAAASMKHTFPDPVLLGANYVLHACGVATSTNGTIWSVQQLPGAVVRSSRTQGDRSGDTMSVVFVQDRTTPDDAGNDGYFIAIGQEGGGTEHTITSKMWKSANGSTWSLIKEESRSDLVSTGGDYATLSAIAKTATAANAITIR